MIAPPKFSQADAGRAYVEWGANCGPGAIAAVCGLTLDELRPHMGDFEKKLYTNPTLMLDTLSRLRRASIIAGWRKVEHEWPVYGLVRIQWEGPWTRPGVPIRVRYRHTHWVASGHHESDVGVFDINCMNNGSGWVKFRDWRDTVVPYILETCVPKADGRWHVTHTIEIDRAVNSSPRE